MTTTEATPKILATVKAADLHRLLADVCPFRGTDDTLPMLTVVHVETDGTRLLAVTTDKFTLGVSKLVFEATDKVLRMRELYQVCTNGQRNADGRFEYRNEPDEFNLRPTDVARLLKASKTVKRDIASRFVTIARNVDDTIEFNFYNEKLVVEPVDVEFPSGWRTLIPETGSQKARSANCFTAEYMAKFAKVDGFDGCATAWTFDDDTQTRHPIVITIGANFLGLIMPVRLPAGTSEFIRPSWIDR
jgi:hypothetical protein